MSFPAAVGRMMGLLRNGSEGVASEAAGLVAVLIGGGPGDASVIDSKGEWYATICITSQFCLLIIVISLSLSTD
jgi:DnaJ family protein C protein 13